jgi:hypothetical protein
MDKIFQGMEGVCRYLERHSTEKPLFVPEYRAADEINGIIRGKPIYGYADTVAMIRRVNEVEQEEHYDGSGWFDYKVRLCAWLREKGFDVRHNNNYRDLEVVKSVDI